MTTAMLTIADLTPEHHDDLRAIAANPRHRIQPQRRKLYKRLHLIQSGEPPAPPRESARRAPLARAHHLTELGRETLAKAPPPVEREREMPLRKVHGTTYVSDSVKRGAFWR